MSDQKNDDAWIVIGASGFVGAAVAEEARRDGLNVVEHKAPRLVLAAPTPGAAREAVAEAEQIVQQLTSRFAGASVVVNAAGLATPDADLSTTLVAANTALPLLVVAAARRAGVPRVIHLSSAAVQGATETLDETPRTAPFSPYSQSKAWAEEALVSERITGTEGASPEIVIVRATSVQGRGRPTTARLQRFAKSPLASVAAPGCAPTPVTSVGSLAEFIIAVGLHAGVVPPIVLQPWEGMTVSSVLVSAGGRAPRRLPRTVCRGLIKVGRVMSRLVGGRLTGPIRRVELMWFGQRQVEGWAAEVGLSPMRRVADVLRHGSESGAA